ncbi:MAG: serine hydrolase [Burkholderia gladioli]
MLSRRTLLRLPVAYCLVRRASPLAAPLPTGPTWPGSEWSRTDPKQAGWNAEAMSEARRYSESIATASFLAVQHGVVIDSWGDIDRRIELRSMRKSLLSALIGIAVSENKIDLGDTLAELQIDDAPPSLTPEEKQATVLELLKARSGVYHAAAYEDPEEKRLRPPRGSHAPGTFWYYNNWDFNTLGAIYEKAVGTSIFESFRTKIAEPIGMQDYRPSDGRYERENTSRFPAYPFHMTARDLARFGLLFLMRGRWGDKQVIPAAWVDESTRHCQVGGCGQLCVTRVVILNR